MSDTKKIILRAALECFTARGVSETRVSDIQESSGISIGSIYHHFGDKEGIASGLVEFGLDDLRHRIRAGLTEAMDLGPEAIIESVVNASATWATDDTSLARYVLYNRVHLFQARTLELDDQTMRYVALINKTIEVAQGGGFKMPPAPLALALVLGPVQEYSRRWLTGRAKVPPTEYIETFAQAAWRSVAP